MECNQVKMELGEVSFALKEERRYRIYIGWKRANAAVLVGGCSAERFWKLRLDDVSFCCSDKVLWDVDLCWARSSL